MTNPGAPAETAASHTPSAAVCANCGVPVSGHFCSNCGQRVEHSFHSVWHFAGEAFEDLTHADSRLWSTVGALLFKPGLLTCEFLAGRRVKYLPPVRLYLVLSLLFFVVAALNSDNEVNLIIRVPQAGSGAVPAQRLELKSSDAERRQSADNACDQFETQGALGRAVARGCHKAVQDNGRALSEAYQHNIPRAIFLGLPILALALKPLYRRRYYVEHLLFLLHNHAFIFLGLAIYNALCLLIPGSLAQESLLLVFALYVLYYYFRGMQRVYGEGPGLTLGKFTVLTLAYVVVAALLLVVTGTYSVLVQ